MPPKTTRRHKEDQNTWNFIFSLIFLVIVVAALVAIRQVRGSFPTSVPVFDAVLMALASFRITRLVVYDKITRFFREWFMDSREVEAAGGEWVELSPLGRGVRQTVHDLLDCPWCIGIWSALVVAFFYFVFPWAWFIIFFLAVAGTGSFIQITANAIGWNAENLKLDVHERADHW